jgi:UDPglucose--hexose-1-phosphate uridylyltransferase
MARIEFESWKQSAVFHNPLRNGELDRQEIEVRLDPLTGHQSIINAGLSEKSSTLFPETDHGYIKMRAEATEPQCFLCGGKWRMTTPRYEAALASEGRMVEGDAVLFPNLFPLAARHAVVMLGNSHFRRLDDFPPALLRDALSVSVRFIRRCHELDNEIRHFTINCNYLLPAGSSVFHPHLQVLGSPFPGSHERLLQGLGLDYHGKTGACYWLDLAAEEKLKGERWVGEIGGSSWFTAYSPVGTNEINAVWPAAQSFLDWTNNDVAAMAEGLSRVLTAYHSLNCSTFNFSCFSAPMDEDHPELRCILRIINRQNMVPDYRTDDFYFQKLLRNEIIVTPPERLAALVRTYFTE